MFASASKENEAKPSNYYKPNGTVMKLKILKIGLKVNGLTMIMDNLAICIISCHGDGKRSFYDSNGKDFSFSHVCYRFNNKNCKSLRNKPKIYAFDIKKDGGIIASSNMKGEDGAMQVR